MIQLSYCTFGLTELTLPDAIDAVDRVGYPGVELSFHRDQFNPFQITDDDLDALKHQFAERRVKPACVATASHFFLPARPHEPSLMCPDLAGRKQRIELIRRGIHVARRLGIPLVTFGSGFIRAEHVADPSMDPHALLVDSIQHCLAEVHDDEDITLLIEPEPGMHIETLEHAIRLVEEIGSPKFRLHLDLCHIYCSEPDIVAALAAGAPYARYLHVSDAEAGRNLKIVHASTPMHYDLKFADYLLYFDESADFLFLDPQHPCYFHDGLISHAQRACADQYVAAARVLAPVAYVDYRSLYAGATALEDEIFTYLISVPGMSFEVLNRARPIVNYLRSTRDADGQLLVPRMVANTLTGIVHYHQIPGEGTLDLGACFKALNDHGFSGYGSVELYHHVAQWEKALEGSYRHLAQFV